MDSERTKMLRGDLYDPQDPQLILERRRARILITQLNNSRADQDAKRAAIIRRLIPESGGGTWIEPPFYCDYGSNIRLGDKVFFNFNCVVLDVAPIHIGSRVLFGPGVQLYAASHPLSAEERASGMELGKPIEIGDDVWIGGGAIICPGVRIGARSVVGAGSVVTKNVPPEVVAAGNPCRVIRPLEP